MSTSLPPTGPAQDPNGPVGEGTAPAAPGKKTGLWVGIIVAAVVVIALIVWAVVAKSAAPEEPAPSASSVAPTTPAPSPSPTGEASPSPSSAAPVAVPATCEDLFSEDFKNKIGVPMNDPTNELEGVEDPELSALLNSIPHLTCTWNSAGESGAGTSIAQVNAEQQAFIMQRLNTLGATCEETRGGTLCEQVHYEDPEYGKKAGRVETAFLRDGIWLSSVEVNFYRYDYTGEIIDHVFGS